MRLSFVTGVLDLGGSTTFLLNLATELQSRRIPNLILSFENEHPLDADFAARGIQVVTQDHRHSVFEDRMTNVYSKLRAFAPTHVIACLSPESFEALRYVPSGIPRFGMVQSDDPCVYETLRAYAPYMDATIGVSQKSAQMLRETKPLASRPVHYLPYGIPVSLPPAPRLSQPGSRLRVLYLGRLDNVQKRVRLLTRIQEQLLESKIPLSWTIAGEGIERSFLETAMTNNELQTVSFTGTVAYGDVPLLLQRHDILLLPSGFEGLPLSLLEAMMAGVVPVVSDLPSGIREVVNEANGILVQPDNIEGYAKGIEKLHFDRKLLAEMATNARIPVVKNFSTTAMADRWVQVLTQFSRL
jgi:glycosyltransferase involved in cell wall biosynthesis